MFLPKRPMTASEKLHRARARRFEKRSPGMWLWFGLAGGFGLLVMLLLWWLR